MQTALQNYKFVHGRLGNKLPSDPVLLYRASRILEYALRVMLNYTLRISTPPARGNLGICAQYQREFEGISAS